MSELTSKLSKLKVFTSTRAVVYSAIIASVYVVLNAFVAPIAYGPLQFRVGNLLYPLVLFNPLYGLGFGLGAFLTNLGSPFGAMDIIVMPIVTVIAAMVAYSLRKKPVIALTLQALIIAVSVSFFVLGIAGAIPFWFTFPGVLASNLFIVLASWFVIWRPFYGKGILEDK